ncbi:hypothetical protein DFH11DRAFT_331511 [Phellopilus nigrolimitatus]|nr:hypothetical protein DFH11DRAFT_331511 [Phellopilus nigrolimitatus]
MHAPPRRHRLPQRLDWNLIPPPLDISKPLVDDKALLPAIIVTPSSPNCDRDFRIAFLASEPKVPESVASRVLSRLKINAPTPLFKQLKQLRPRTLLLVFLPLFILFCHVLAHRLATHRPHLHFDTHTQGGIVTVGDGPAVGGSNGWFDMNDYWDAKHARELITEDEPKPVQ